MRTFYHSIRPHLFFIVLFLLTLALVAGVAVRTQKGPHGGTLKRADVFYIEMKQVDAPGSIIPKKLFAYLLDKNMKAFSNQDVSGDVTFLFPDATSNTIPLKPDAVDAFTCEVPADYVSCKVSFNLQGKILSADFSSPQKIVKKQ